REVVRPCRLSLNYPCLCVSAASAAPQSRCSPPAGASRGSTTRPPLQIHLWLLRQAAPRVFTLLGMLSLGWVSVQREPREQEPNAMQIFSPSPTSVDRTTQRVS